MPRARLFGHHAAGSAWQLAVRPPAPALAAVVAGDYIGYDESSAVPVHRRQFANPGAVLIIDLGPPMRLRGSTAPGPTVDPTIHPTGFLAPPGAPAVITEHDGRSRGIEVRLTPFGAHLLLLNAPMSDLAGRILGLAHILADDHDDLIDQLHTRDDWDARFDLLERALLRRLARARPASRELQYALTRITACAGRIDIADLAAELGRSQKSLIHHFNTQIGLPPKRYARLVRFDHVVQHIRGGAPDDWAELAARFGYYDQSHLVHDFRQFTGLTPTAARASLTPFPV